MGKGLSLGYLVPPVFFLHLFWKREASGWHRFLWATCPSYHTTDSVKALKEIDQCDEIP